MSKPTSGMSIKKVEQLRIDKFIIDFRDSTKTESKNLVSHMAATATQKVAIEGIAREKANSASEMHQRALDIYFIVHRHADLIKGDEELFHRFMELFTMLKPFIEKIETNRNSIPVILNSLK